MKTALYSFRSMRRVCRSDRRGAPRVAAGYAIWLAAASMTAAMLAKSSGMAPAKPAREVAVTPDPRSSTAGIQEAIDRLGPEGGVVLLGRGVYALRRSIRITGPLTLRGAGPATILCRPKQAEARLLAAAAPESRSLHVDNAGGFRAGDEIGLFDRDSVGWLNAHGVVKAVRGREILLEGRVPKGYAFDPAKGGGVVNYFPAITSWDVSRITLRDLTIDGRREDNPGPTDRTVRDKDLAFTFAAIHLWNARETRIEGVRVLGWPGDGISLQTGNGVAVTRCVVEGCRGKGYHPGGGLRDSQFIGNVARGNGDDGLYFCSRTERILVKNNRFIGNNGSGVGGLGDDGDTQNVVERNLCKGNGRAGIALFDGEGNTVRGNTCVSNSRLSPGAWGGINLAKTSRSIVSDNRCFDDRKAKTQPYGIFETETCRGNVITGNDCRGNARSGLLLQGKDGRRDGNTE